MRYVLFASMLLLLYACDLQQQGEDYIYGKYQEVTSHITLSDQVITRYCHTYTLLREQGPEFLAYTEGGAEGQAGFDKFEAIVKKGGFKDYPEFVATNARIAWAWNLSQGEVGMEVFQNMHNQGVAQLLFYINHPDTPAPAKDSLRVALKRLKANWAHNKPWADYVLNKVKPLTNDADVALVKKHTPCIMQAYTGLSYDVIQQSQHAGMGVHE